MTESEVLESVITVIADHMQIEEDSIAPETPLVFLEMDEFDTIELIIAIEDKFSINLPDYREFDFCFKDIDSIAQYISDKILR